MEPNGRVAVLGGYGFVGSALVRRLLDAGAERIVVVDRLAGKRPADMLPADPRIESVAEDVRHLRLADVGAPPVVYYLCAAPYVPDSHQDPARTMEANVEVLQEFLDNNRADPPFSLVYASSGEVYGHVADGCAAETRPLADPNTLNPYGATRVLAEQVLFDFCEKLHIKSVALRLFNVVGPRATQPYFVPEMVRQIAKSGVVHHGELSTVRDFVWIGDTVDAMVAAVPLCQSAPLAVNLASGVGWSMREVLRLLLSVAGREEMPTEQDPERLRPVELHRLVGCGDLAERALNWRSRVALPEALRRTFDAYRRAGSWPYESGPRS